MNIQDLLLKDIMLMDMQATSKEAAIDEMIASLDAHQIINDPTLFKEKILAREAQTSTGLGDGIAMPHAKTTAVNQAAVLFAKSQAGVDYESLDGQKAHLFFMIAAPEGANDTHLQALAGLSRLLVNPDFVASLKEAKNADEVQHLFATAQAEKEAEESAEKAEQTNSSDTESRPLVVAVTACPTGIAHTYMAEDALKKKAAEMNVDIIVETNGSEGVQHRLSEEDIRDAVAVIVAADKNVEMNRFDGKPVIQVPVSDGIRKTENLIQRAIEQKAPIFHGDGSKDSTDYSEDKASIGSQIYKHLMSGVSNMLPFVVGGGILIALAFVFGGINTEGPVAELLNTVGGQAFTFLIPILAGFIGMSIADRPGFMPAFVAGAISATAGAGFLGGLIGGFLGGYVVIGLKKLFKGLPKSLDGVKPVLLYPVLGVLITGALMILVFNPPFIWLNDLFTHWLNTLSGANAILLGAILGGMMAIDMGGPINKAAYAFSIVALDAGNANVQASVVIGGMIPPLAIAVAATIFKHKFTAEERKAAPTNYIMGASFITEGAIPFAASDPLRVISASVVGSATAGALVQLWNVTYPAPHGGLFVFMLGDNPLMFLIALIIGTTISAVILGLLKKTVVE